MGQQLNAFWKMSSARFPQFLFYISVILSKYNLEGAWLKNNIDIKIMLEKIKPKLLGNELILKSKLNGIWLWSK